MYSPLCLRVCLSFSFCFVSCAWLSPYVCVSLTSLSLVAPNKSAWLVLCSPFSLQLSLSLLPFQFIFPHSLPAFHLPHSVFSTCFHLLSPVLFTHSPLFLFLSSLLSVHSLPLVLPPALSLFHPLSAPVLFSRYCMLSPSFFLVLLCLEPVYSWLLSCVSGPCVQ